MIRKSTGNPQQRAVARQLLQAFEHTTERIVQSDRKNAAGGVCAHCQGTFGRRRDINGATRQLPQRR